MFCVDKSMSSLTLAQKIGASITEAFFSGGNLLTFGYAKLSKRSFPKISTSGMKREPVATGSVQAQSGLTTQQLVARMYLLNDVPRLEETLSHCKPLQATVSHCKPP